jgi:hypothetical protein
MLLSAAQKKENKNQQADGWQMTNESIHANVGRQFLENFEALTNK